MKWKFRVASVILTVVLVLAIFPMSASALQYAPCNRARFISDVTVPDGSPFAPGDKFTKTWKVLNTGTCTWTKDYALVFTSGEDFDAPATIKLTADVPPWTYADLTIVDMVAPTAPGKHFSYWKLDNGTGDRFGVGWGGGVPIFALINVVTPPSVTYDFTAKAATATWSSGAGALTFPGTASDPNGAVIEQATPKFENGVTASTAGLVVSPNRVNNGYIQGMYTEGYTVKKGDRFQTTVGCEYDSKFCYVAFSLKYQIGTGPVYTLWTFREKYEGLTYSANINLDRLAGKTVNFILYMSAYGPSEGDSAIWGHPVIVGTGSAGGGSLPTTGWNTYIDSTVPFSFLYPPGSTIDYSKNTITLPKGTGSVTKTLEISKPAVSATPAVCLSNIPNPSDYEAFTSTKGIDFNKENGHSGPTLWYAYTAIKPATGSGTPTCVSLALQLSSTDPFNPAADVAMLETIANTFEWK